MQIPKHFFPSALALIWPWLPDGSTIGGAFNSVEATLVGIEVLKRLGVTGKPLPCSLRIMNLEASWQSACRVPRYEWPREAYSFEAEAKDVGAGLWWAHLVIETFIEGRRGILDLDLAQYCAIELGIETVPTYTEFGRDHRDHFTIHDPDGTTIELRALRHLIGFKQSALWRAGPNEDLVQLVLERMSEVHSASELRPSGAPIRP
jgi:hypothetical protein